MKFKKTLIISLAAVLAASSVIGLAACGEGGGGDGGGGGKDTKGFTTVKFWGGGDKYEVEVFDTLVTNFNNTIGKEKKIIVSYDSGHDDYTTLQTQIAGKTPPDVVYVPDRQFKKWASMLLLEPLTSPADGTPLYDGVEEFTEGQIWDWGINRYRMDIRTSNSTPDSTLWALPKDIGPSVLYYNRDYLKFLEIEHISVDIGTPEFEAAGYPEKGYFEMNGKWYFNNRVPMSWEEVTDLGIRLQTQVKGYQANNETFNCGYGYFTEWWFNYGYGVGGDCVEYIPEPDDEDGNAMGYYQFTLNDTTPNWIVKDNEPDGIDIGDNHYGPGETVIYTDKEKMTQADKDKCNELPTMYDAFLEFVSLTAKSGTDVGENSKGVMVKGKQVSMGQSSIGTDSAMTRFASGQIGMFVGLRSCVTYLRNQISDKNLWMKDENSWDVAPLPVYKEYNPDGTVKVHGKMHAGHSGSMGLAITYGSKKKKAAWELVKYIAGEEGQKAQSEAGFVIPNQIELANSEVFLQSNQAPKNSQVFIDAALNQQPADWWYLTDWTWIDGWANALNTRVREPDAKNTMTVQAMFEEWGPKTQLELYKKTYSSHNLAAKPKK